MASAAPRRHPRRSAPPLNYDESLPDAVLDSHLGVRRLRRPRTAADRARETRREALLAADLGFPPSSLLPSEFSAAAAAGGPGTLDPAAYAVVRNHILARWRADVRSPLSVAQVRESVSSAHDHLIHLAFNYLSHNGFINFGLLPIALPNHAHNLKHTVVVIGAGLAGLSAARHLLSFGFRVLVLEGRSRPGGRVFTLDMCGSSVDLGGSIITGTDANPLSVISKQLGVPLHKIRDKCPLYRADGSEVDGELDVEIDATFNRLLDKATELRGVLGERAEGVSLGTAVERLREMFAAARGEEERELLDWHLANLEYANAGCLDELSLAHWDQDDPFEMGGDHCFLDGGNWRLVHALCEDLPVLYGRTVMRVEYGEEGVEVVVAGGQVFRADMVLCTVPLGILKRGSIKFDPELPTRKLGAIERLGFGLLNKVAMVFPRVFWGEDLDTFGCVNKDRSKRGEFFLFYSYHTVAGGPVLIALVAGEAALAFESTDPALLLHRVLGVLRGIYSPRGVDVPDPIQTVCTRWGSDPLCYGSYSHVRVGSSGEDYDILAESLGGRLFFAGEATNRQYPATMHGAFLSGLREASRILDTWSSRAIANDDPMKCLQKSTKSCSDILLRLFKEPDIVSENFSFVFNPFTTEDPNSMGLVRVFIGKTGNEACRKDNVHHESVGLKQFTEPQLQDLHLYAILSREQARQIQLVHGGSSGIGTFAIQIAKYKGARVFVTAGSEEKLAACKQFGADVGINYRTEDFVTRVKEETGGKGVDVILDSIAGSYFQRNLDSLNVDGRLFMIGILGGTVTKVDISCFLAKRLTVQAARLRNRSSENKAAIVAEVEKHVWPAVTEGKVKPVVYKIFPLSEAAEAHRLMETSTHIGKILLVP